MARAYSSLVVMMASAGIFAAKSARALEIVTPSQGLIVVADRTYTVEWTGTGDDNRFEIDLYYCGSYCLEEDCGEWVTALCPYGESGCPDNEGDYDIVMPEPMDGTSGSGYKVRVMDVADADGVDCSDEFYLMASDEAPTVGDPDGPYLYVTSPAEGNTAEAGEEYTIEFNYDNGVGSRVDRFKIDLYLSEGTGDCGTWVTNLCDKESIGCKDSMGDYDVVIPADVPKGDYSIRVGRFEDDSLYGCSGVFELIEAGAASGNGFGSGSVSGSDASGSSSSGSAYGEGSGYGYGGGSGSGSGMGSGSGVGTGSGSGSGAGSGNGAGSGSGSGNGSASGSGGGDGGGDGSGSGSAGSSVYGGGSSSYGASSSGSGSGGVSGSGKGSGSSSASGGGSGSGGGGGGVEGAGSGSGGSGGGGGDDGDHDDNSDGGGGGGGGSGDDEDEWSYSYSFSFSFSFH